MTEIHSEPATAERWDDVVAVMGTRGDPARCWCQFFRFHGRSWRDLTPTDARELLQQQVLSSAPPPGVLAYADQEPVGWCAVAPKDSYPRLLRSRDTEVDNEGVWSVTCFVVKVGWRRRGVAAKLLDGAVDLARSAGASTVEAYPVDPSARRSVSAAELYHGTLSTFGEAGFEEVRRSAAARPLVQLAL